MSILETKMKRKNLTPKKVYHLNKQTENAYKTLAQAAVSVIREKSTQTKTYINIIIISIIQKSAYKRNGVV